MARSRTTNFRGKIHIEIWVDTVCSGNEYELLIGTFCFHVYTYMIDPFSNYESFGTKFNWNPLNGFGNGACERPGSENDVYVMYEGSSESKFTVDMFWIARFQALPAVWLNFFAR